ncbi:MAG: NAD-dependent epimerase/dehydratase family protein [Nocardioidaceae bacterium]
MSDMNVVIGYGPVGATVTEQLVQRGEQVRVVTRSGSGPTTEPSGLVEVVRGDALDPTSLAGLFDHAAAVYDCMHGDKYSARNWWQVLPTADRNVRDEAGRAGAVVVYPESLYGFDPTAQPFTESSPRVAPTEMGRVRAQLIDDRLTSSTPTVSIVASDFFGPKALTAHGGARMLSAVFAGKTVRVLGSADQPHSFTYVPDLAAAMIAAAVRSDLWGQVLCAPTSEPVTQRQMALRYAEVAGLPAPKIGVLPTWGLRLAGVAMPEVRSIAGMQYQFDQPFVLDSSQSEAALGQTPTPFDEATAATVDWWQHYSA